MTEDRFDPATPAPGSWALVAIAWVLVLVPLFWGVFKTFELARQLFR